MTAAEKHFDLIARDYDFWKKKNWYYYHNLAGLYCELILSGQSVLEIGCGTGDILARLDPSRGRGTDISAEMIAVARRKYAYKSNLTFDREDIFDSAESFPYDRIFLADVLEHVEDLPAFLGQLARRTRSGTRVIITIANPLWEPILMLAEKLGQKMPEGPHERISLRKLRQLFEKVGFSIQKEGYRLLIPKKVPGGDWLNRRFHRWPLLRRLGFTVYWVLEK